MMSLFTFLVGFVVLLHESCCIGIEDEIVNRHNDLRRGVTPSSSNMLKMTWSPKIASEAQKWADTCNMRHSPSSLGENLYMSSHQRSWTTAVDAWYSEVNRFKYGVGSVTGHTVGHFTQVVWYRSNEVGCGMAHCPNSRLKYFYVCQYNPPGNYQSHHPYKEGKPCGDCPDNCDNKLCTNPCPYVDRYSNCPRIYKSWGCKGSFRDKSCPASCKCPTEIK